jgi:hypothetical protein
VRHETEVAEARTWGRLSSRQPVARGEQWRIHPRAGVSGVGCWAWRSELGREAKVGLVLGRRVG